MVVDYIEQKKGNYFVSSKTVAAEGKKACHNTPSLGCRHLTGYHGSGAIAAWPHVGWEVPFSFYSSSPTLFLFFGRAQKHRHDTWFYMQK